jgi:hypothetical protein
MKTSRKTSRKSSKKSSRTTLFRMLRSDVFSHLNEQGFTLMEEYSSRIDYNFHRKRNDGGYDLIYFWFDKYFRPVFRISIGKVDNTGLNRPWGHVDASQVCAGDLSGRIFFIKRSRNIFSRLFAKLFFPSVTFSVPRKADEETAIRCAKRVTAEILSTLLQAEKWWQVGEIGNDLRKPFANKYPEMKTNTNEETHTSLPSK